MKQTMKLKANDLSGIKADGLVSSAKGIIREFKIIRCKSTNFKQRTMDQHEIDLIPGPLTVSGFKGGSCWQVNLPGTDRMPVMPSVKGRHRFKAGICFDLSASGFLEQDKRRKLILKKHAGSRDFINPEIILPGVSECIDMTEFRRQNNWLAICYEKTYEMALKAYLCSFTQSYGANCIYLGKCVRVSYGVVNRHSGMIASMQTGIQTPFKKPSQWRKTIQMKQRMKLSNRLEYPAAGIGIWNRYSKN